MAVAASGKAALTASAKRLAEVKSGLNSWKEMAPSRTVSAWISRSTIAPLLMTPTVG